MLTCPNGHGNPDHYHYCGECGQALAPPPIQSASPVQPQDRWNQRSPQAPAQHMQGPTPYMQGPNVPAPGGVQRGWRAWPIGAQIGAIAGVFVVIAAVALVVSVTRAGKGPDGRSGANESPSGQSVTRSYSRDDLLAAVCKVGTWQNGSGYLRNADGQGQCMASHADTPLFIGQYTSSFEATNDVNVLTDRSYAIGTNEQGTTWVVLAVWTGSQVEPALEPLVQFGFQIGQSPNR